MKTVIALAALAIVHVTSVAAEMNWEAEVDWEAKGCVTSVKDQGACGASWAFAATAGLESGYCAHTYQDNKGTLYELSAQDIVSCSRKKASCAEDYTPNAYDWVGRLSDGSICTDKSYPYESESGAAPTCKRFSDPSFKCEKPEIGAYFYQGGRLARTQIESAVLQQPVVGRLNAKWEAFRNYTGGLLTGNETACPSWNDNHEVLIVGFGTCDGVPCWKIKNSWGPTWGNNGYAYIERGFGYDGVCGVEKYGYYPVFTTPSDSRVSKRTSPLKQNLELLGDEIRDPQLLSAYGAVACAKSCVMDSRCVAYSYYSSFSFCKLFSSVTGNTTSENTKAIYSANVITKAESLGTCLPIMDNAEYPGNTIFTTAAATAEECCDHCDAISDCNAFTWSKAVNGVCSLKSQATATPVVSAPASDGTLLFQSGIKYKCQPLQMDTAIDAFAVGSAPSSTAANCCGICRASPNLGCNAFSWTDENGGTCWFKSIDSTSPGPVAKAGVISAIVF